MDRNEPLVSVIAICHHHGPYLRQTLDSIRAQTYRSIQFIVINNLEDECESLIRNWIEDNGLRDEVQFRQNTRPRTVCENLNLGLSLARGEYFQGVSCDDVLMPNKLEMQVQMFGRLGPEFACVYGNARDIDEHGNVIDYDHGDTLFAKRRRQGMYAESHGSLAPQLRRTCYISAPTVLLRTAIIRSVGGYSEDYLFDDYPMWVKLERAGYKFAHTDEVLVGQRILATSLGRSNPGLKRSSALLYLRNIRFFGFSLKRIVRSLWILWRPVESADGRSSPLDVP